MFVMISKVTDSSSGTIEKDDRPEILNDVKENTTWYIMHNLQQINAVALTGNYQVLISAPVSVDEMKSIIDSIYELTKPDLQQTTMEIGCFYAKFLWYACE